MSDLEIARDDIALSAIAGGATPDSDDPTLLLLASYRADLDDAAAEPVAVPALPMAPPAVVPPRSRRHRAALVALSAAAGLVVGGITAGVVAVSDRPGESLYAVHAAIFGAAEDTADEATALLDQAAGRLARGDRAGARRLLGQAAPLVGAAPESDRARLRARLDDLMVLAAEPVRPSPRPTSRPSPSETPEPTESETDDDSSGSGSSGSGSDPSESDDNSGSGSSNSGKGSSSSGSGSDDLKTFDPDKSDNSGSGSD